MLAKSMTGEELARQIIAVLSTEFGIPSSLAIASSQDRAYVNAVAMRTLSIIYNNIVDSGFYILAHSRYCWRSHANAYSG